MKKIMTIAAMTVLPFLTQAQVPSPDPWRDVNYAQLMENMAMILTLGLTALFVLTLIRMLQNNRLKNKMIEKGVSDKVVEQFLQPTVRDTKGIAIKWALILFCIGGGLTVIHYSLPLGIHSLAIMAFSISASFFGYFWYVRQSEK